jgi:hypothetical protein
MPRAVDADEVKGRTKMNRTVLAAAAIIAFVGMVQSPAGAETKVCRGLLTANWTEGAANFSPDDGTRLIRADDINGSCLFTLALPAGRKIISVCKMGFACEVKAQLKNEPADVFIIGQVFAVVNIGEPKQRKRRRGY